jgi:hypothetical protein
MLGFDAEICEGDAVFKNRDADGYQEFGKVGVVTCYVPSVPLSSEVAERFGYTVKSKGGRTMFSKDYQ